MTPSSVHDTRGLVGDLIESGRYLDAIDALTELAERDPSVELEVTLASLRRDAFAELADLSPPVEDDAATPADPFPGIDLPEIERHELSIDVLRGALHHHGVLMVRGLVDRDAALELSDDVDRAFAERERWRAGAPAPETAPWFVPLDEHPQFPMDPIWAIGRQLEKYHRVLTVDSPRVLFRLFRALRQADLDRVLTEYLGSRPVLAENKFCIRQMPYRANGVSNLWHQEASVFGAKEPMTAVNLWLALTECGTNAPAIEFLPTGLAEVVPAEKAYAVGPESARAATQNRPPASPDFGPGDGVLFSEMVFHRTRQHKEMTGLRRNVEAWFFAPWNHPRHNGCVVF